MSGRFSTLRFVSLLSLGALVVHQLRYQVGYHEHAEAALREQGHAYLGMVGILVAVSLALAFACLGAILMRARRGRPAIAYRRAAFGTTWAYTALSLASIYVAQEWLEGQLVDGHAAGLAGIAGHGGWIAFLLAAVIGAAVALLVRGSDALITLAARRALRPQRRAARSSARPPRFIPRRVDALAGNLAGRGPPLPS